MTCPQRHPMEERVLDRLRPKRLQLMMLERVYRLVKGRLERCLKARGLEAVVEVQGSYAKGTILSDTWEIDVFVLFKGVSDEWVTGNAEALLGSCLSGLPIVSRYAQHPYVTVSLMGVEADVVPGVWTERPRPRGMGVERTPFHTRYVKSRLNPCLADDVRLLKSFLKGIGAYGAETHVGGFSGYLAELLVIALGGFRGVLEAASHWRPPVYIDPSGSGDRGLLEKRYGGSPMIVVDPVDPARNAAAAVRIDKLASLVLASRLYLAEPAEHFFHVTPRGPARGYKPDPARLAVLLYTGRLHEHPPEAVWGRAMRAARLLASRLEEAGFTVARHWFYTDESSYAVAVVEVLEAELPGLQLALGPEAWLSPRAERFAWKRSLEGMPAWIGPDGRLAGLRPRKHARLPEAVAGLGGDIPAPPGAVLGYAGDLRGVPEPWRGRIYRLYLGSLPSWLASPPRALGLP